MTKLAAATARLESLVSISDQLDAAAVTAQPMAQLGEESNLNIEDAYVIQDLVVQHRVSRGHPVTGVKLGFTNPLKAAQMGLSDVIMGQITSDMCIEDGGIVDLDSRIHVRAEPELAFRLGADVDPHDPVASVLRAVDAVAPAIEYIDSRYKDFRFSLVDVVADNTSASGYSIGSWTPFGAGAASIDLSNLGVNFEVDGTIIETGSTAAILGNPLRALEATKRMAARFGLALPAGTIILAGAATVATALSNCRSVRATITGLGSVSNTIQ